MRHTFSLRLHQTIRAIRQPVLWAVVAVHTPSMAQVYVGGDDTAASVVLSNFQTIEAPQLLLEAPGSAPPALRSDIAPIAVASTTRLKLPPVTPELRRLIDDVAVTVGVSAHLLHAVIAQESSYRSRAVSPKGAIGLMQLMPATALRFGARDPYEPRQNVMAGAAYLKWLMALFKDDLELALAAYNAGEQAVLRAGSRIPAYAETQAYVPRVLAYLRCASTAACRPG